MKTTKQNFELFKQECEKWINKLGLIGYEIRYFHNNKYSGGGCKVYLPENFCELSLDTEFTDLKDNTTINEQIKIIAKHEVIHLLVGRMAINGQARWCSKTEHDEAEEELVRKLEKLIN